MSNETTTAGVAAIHAGMTVNEIIAAAPGTVAVFSAWGVDACCGGGIPLATVAQKHGFDPGAILAELNAAT